MNVNYGEIVVFMSNLNKVGILCFLSYEISFESGSVYNILH